MLKELRPALVTLALLTAITGLAYPLLVTGVAGVAVGAARFVRPTEAELPEVIADQLSLPFQ